MKQNLLILLLFLTLSIKAQELQNTQKRFQGLYAGASFGIQNIFGGAFIDDLDLLAQKSGFVFELLGGYRLQLLDRRFVLGAEYLYGFSNGDMNIRDPRYSFVVNYRNDHQIGLSLNLGYAFGESRDYLAYFMIGQGRRNFDISFMDLIGASHVQKDQQNFDRFGLGFEANISQQISTRVNASKIFVDYGELKVSQDVEDKLDVNLALIFQL
ncbi:MAG: outer membrane beta-barrel protein [Cyclobacteriaceae bacterium]